MSVLVDETITYGQNMIERMAYSLSAIPLAPCLLQPTGRKPQLMSGRKMRCFSFGSGSRGGSAFPPGNGPTGGVSFSPGNGPAGGLVFSPGNGPAGGFVFSPGNAPAAGVAFSPGNGPCGCPASVPGTRSCRCRCASFAPACDCAIAAELVPSPVSGCPTTFQPKSATEKSIRRRVLFRRTWTRSIYRQDYNAWQHASHH